MHHIEQESVLDSYTNDLKTNLETALLGPYLIRDAMREIKQHIEDNGGLLDVDGEDISMV